MADRQGNFRQQLPLRAAAVRRVRRFCKCLVRKVLVFAGCFASVLSAGAFEVSVGGVRVPVHPARVSAVPMNQVWAGYQRPIEQTTVASFVTFDMNGAVELSITPSEVEDCGEPVILPMSYRPEMRRAGRALVLRVDRPRPFTVSFGSEGRVLHVFANPPFVAPTGPRVRRFGPGEHHVGVITPTSGETIVLDEGAVVYGAIFIAHARDVRVCGRGIVDASFLERGLGVDSEPRRAARAAGFADDPYGSYMAVTAFNCAWATNVVVEGVTFRDPSRWTMMIRAHSKNVTVDNVKIVGCWRYNSDGINVCASEDVAIRNSFVRSFDDCIVARGAYLDGESRPTRNVLVENCVLWCDWGKCLEVWAGHRPCLIENVTYRNLQLVHTDECVVCDVTTWFASSDTRIRNVTMENIEVDYPGPIRRQHLQTSRDDAVYRGGTADRQYLVRVDCASYGRNLGNQKIEATTDLSGFRVRYENLTFRNFTVLGTPPKLVASVDAATAPHTIDGIRFAGLPESVAIEMNGTITNKAVK